MGRRQKSKQKKQQACFTTKRNEFFNRAQAFSNVTGAKVAVVAFSPNGTPFAFGNPSVDTVVDDYLSLHTSRTDGTAVGDDTEKAVGENKESFWWDTDVNSINDVEELERFKSALIDLKEKIVRMQKKERENPSEVTMTNHNWIDEMKEVDFGFNK